MTLHWSNAVPQGMQQHGSPPKQATEAEQKPPEAIAILSTLAQPGRFASSPACESKVTKT
jgi:hypothetical protein